MTTTLISVANNGLPPIMIAEQEIQLVSKSYGWHKTRVTKLCINDKIVCVSQDLMTLANSTGTSFAGTCCDNMIERNAVFRNDCLSEAATDENYGPLHDTERCNQSFRFSAGNIYPLPIEDTAAGLETAGKILCREDELSFRKVGH